MRGRCWRGLIIGMMVAFACAEEGVTAQPATSEMLGVKHRIDAQISVEAGSSLVGGSRELRGAIAPSIRISANSRETRYFGTVSPNYSDIQLSDKATILVPYSKIWEETACHQRRGMPKVTVTQIKGTFEDARGRLELLSVVRRIGLHVPPDELTPGIKLQDGRDAVGSYHALRAHTRDSRINVDLKIYAFDCAL